MDIMIKRGDFAKISRDGERFWVEILDRHDDPQYLTGRVNNECIVAPYKFGEHITFRTDEILDVFKEDDQ